MIKYFAKFVQVSCTGDQDDGKLAAFEVWLSSFIP